MASNTDILSDDLRDDLGREIEKLYRGSHVGLVYTSQKIRGLIMEVRGGRYILVGQARARRRFFGATT